MNTKFLFRSLVCAAFAVIAACGDKTAVPVPTAAAPADANIVVADAALRERLKVAVVEQRPFSDQIRVPGRIDFDRKRMARIGAPVTGRVTDIGVTLGQAVKPGDVLARLHSTELGAAELAYLKARSHTDLLLAGQERARQLFAADVISKAELQRRENEYAVAAAELRAAQDQLAVLGMSRTAVARLAATGEINSLSPVAATLAGSVVEIQVAAGQVVQPADALFTVADLSRVWAVAEVPEQQADLVAAGQQVEIEVPALGNKAITGELIYVGQVVNPGTRTVLVRTAIDNADGRLKPAMLATMLIASRPVDSLVVPAAAVVRADQAAMVFVEVDPGRYRAVRVQLGPDHNGEQSVLAGLKAGDRVVADGAFHLNNLRTGAVAE